MKLPSPSSGTLLVLNLVFGALLALANGGAILVTISGGRSHLGGQLGEVALWALAGVALLITSIIGMRQQARGIILGVQACIVFSLAGALAAVGVLVVSKTWVPSHAFVWVPGILSALAVYAFLILRSATASSTFTKSLQVVALVMIAAFLVIDIATFASLTGR